MVNWLYNIKSIVFIKQFMAWTSHRILTVHFTFKTLQLTHQGDNEQSCLQMFEYSFHSISFKNDKVTSVECQVMTVAKITFQPVMTVQCNLVLLFFWQCIIIQSRMSASNSLLPVLANFSIKASKTVVAVSKRVIVLNYWSL